MSSAFKSDCGYHLHSKYIDYILSHTPSIPHTSTTTNPQVFVAQYLSRGTSVYAYGPERTTGKTRVLEITAVTTSLFFFGLPTYTEAILANLASTNLIKNGNYLKTCAYNVPEPLRVNTQGALHTLCTLAASAAGASQPRPKLYRVDMSSMASVLRLHNHLTINTNYHRWIYPIGFYNIEIMMNMYQATLSRRWNNQVLGVYVNANFDVDVPTSEVRLPAIYYDIETMTTEPKHFPTGRGMADRFVSMAVCDHVGGNQEVIVIIPNLEVDHDTMDYEGMHVRLYRHEVDGLQAALRLLLDPFGDGTFALLHGWNSLSYDIRFLLRRAAVYAHRMPSVLLHAFQYVNRGAINYGFNTIHLDMMRFFRLAFQGLASFKLDHVSKSLLGTSTGGQDEGKADFDPVTQIPALYECLNGAGCPTTVQTLTDNAVFRMLLVYNMHDSVLLQKIDRVSGASLYQIQTMRDHHIPLTRIPTYETTEYIAGPSALKALDLGVILTHHTGNVSRFLVEGHSVYSSDYRYLQSRNQLFHDEDDVTHPVPILDYNHNESTSIKGGFNTCNRMAYAKLVLAGDFKSAYPSVIAKANASWETMDIVSSHALKRVVGDLPMSIKENTHLFTYCDHQKRRPDVRPALQHVLKSLDEHAFVTGRYLPHIRMSLAEFHSRMGTPREVHDTVVWYVLLGTPVLRGVLSDLQAEINTHRTKAKATVDRITAEIAALGDKESPHAANLRQDLLFNNNVIRSLKRIAASVYGTTASKHRGIMACPHLAMFITFMTRSGLIDVAKVVGRCMYADTDSVFAMVDDEHTAQQLRAKVEAFLVERYPFFEMEFEFYHHVFFFGKKVYIFAKDANGAKIDCRGITKNGPPLWRELLFDSYRRLYIMKQFDDANSAHAIPNLEQLPIDPEHDYYTPTHPSHHIVDAIEKLYVHLYITTYDRFQRDPDCVAFDYHLRAAEEYVGENSERQKFLKEYPDFNGLRTARCFFAHVPGKADTDSAISPIGGVFGIPHASQVNVYKYIRLGFGKYLDTLIAYWARGHGWPFNTDEICNLAVQAYNKVHTHYFDEDI